jgi:toxin ParE1/3/4
MKSKQPLPTAPRKNEAKPPVRKLLLTQQAIEDLTQICDYLQQHNPVAAKRLIKTFRAKFNLLTMFPHLGRERNDILLNLRCLVVLDYLIFYQPSDQTIEILFVRHSAQDQSSLFKN